MISSSVDVGHAVRLRLRHWRQPGAEAALPFLLVHGLASNARLWDGVAAVLADGGHPAVAVDLRGHGGSDRPDGGYDHPRICADLVAVLDHLGWDRAVAVGQSWGGNVVVELAARRPRRLAGICGIDGGAIRLAARFGTWDACRAALTPPAVAGRPAADLRAGLAAAHPDWPAGAIDATMACFEVRADGTVAPWLSLEHHLAILAAMFADDPARLYPTLEVPTLLVGAADPRQRAWTAGKRADLAVAERLLPRGRVVWFDPADHDVHAQRPVDVADLLLGQVADGFFA